MPLGLKYASTIFDSKGRPFGGGGQGFSGRSFHTTRRRGRCCQPTSSFQACPAKPTRRRVRTAALFRSYAPADANLQTVRAIAAVVGPKPEAQRHRTLKLRGRMSAVGAKRTCRSHSAMSGFGGHPASFLSLADDELLQCTSLLMPQSGHRRSRN